VATTDGYRDLQVRHLLFIQMCRHVSDVFTPLRIVQAIDAQQHNKDAHSTLLEKEMGAALTELQALVQEARSYIAKEVGGCTCVASQTLVVRRPRV